jgi:hypothetical protein
VFPLNLYARVRFLDAILRTRPRVQRAPGLPCALFFLGARFNHNSGELRREIVKLRLQPIPPPSSPAKAGDPVFQRQQ